MKFLGLVLDWSGVGSIITASIAVAALLVAIKELRAARVAGVEEIYKEFLTQSLGYPTFISPDPKLVKPEKQLFNGNEELFWQYEVYIDLMLTAFEELFYLGAPDEKLRKYMGGYLYAHDRYLTSKYFEENFVGEMDKDFWKFADHARMEEKKKWE